MKNLKFLFIFMLVTSISCAQKSPRLQSKGAIDGVNIAIDYGAPSVKGRTIWGGLEKYDKVWRAGANENTTISFDAAVTIDGEELPAGKYGFFIIPKKGDDWTIIFNTKNDGWGAYSYDEKDDALRVDITPEFGDENQEQLFYGIMDNEIIFAWEKVKLTIPVASL
ncbi:DUF2911 domain-containing protein [Aureibaculum marinum]|uniref:DUF2911 domain-containing protein n=1 Tax=Aureibaculum marinum TaxID=2487930 RepID=A0A3N4NG47_9FLAO|nr:DUF2911 domain-containing protein [Aureibaculum marinum]RPD94385.1 DUF2911 domain-containing protein [Aureibaculum marinum]